MKELQPIERYNWLYHIHYVRAEFDICEEQVEKRNCISEYSIYIKGLIKLRNGDAKGAFGSFYSLKTTNNPTYIKAIGRCLSLLGQHQAVCELIKDIGLKLSTNDWQLWSLYGNSLLFLGQIGQAKDAFQNALQTTNQIEPFLSLAQCMIAESDNKSAIFVLRRATE